MKAAEGHVPLKLGGVLAGTFSGFVHGAYVHLMELFGGDAPRFHTSGLLDTPRFQECLGNQVNHVLRSLLWAEGVGHRTARPDVVDRCLDLAVSLARQTKCVQPDGIRILEERRRRPLVKPA